jgi:hypothetical protein
MRRSLRSTFLLVALALIVGAASFAGVRHIKSRAWAETAQQKHPCSAQSVAMALAEDPQRATESDSGPGAGSKAREQSGREGKLSTKPYATFSSDSDGRDEWAAVPLGDGRNLGQYRSAFQYRLSKSAAMQGIRDHCVYDGVYRPEGSEPTILTLNVSTTADGFRIERAAIRHAGLLDEYQLQCVVEWLTGADLEASGIEPGRHYRVTYPMRLGETKPRESKL